MPNIDGVNVCREVRSRSGGERPYIIIIILISRGRQEDIVERLDAGASDYVVKPFGAAEVRVRLRVDGRMIEPQLGLSARVK
jgi:DNA-binding response OmpR family regulator